MNNKEHQRAWRARLKGEARKEFDSSRYQRNKAKYLERSRAFAKANPHISQAATHQSTVSRKYPDLFAASTITNKQLAEYLRIHRGTPCYYCTDPATHLDHIVPLSYNGAHAWENIRMLCEFCNMAKNNYSEVEFIEKIKKILRHHIEPMMPKIV